MILAVKNMLGGGRRNPNWVLPSGHFNLHGGIQVARELAIILVLYY
jgi:hypothetical protein